MRALALRRAPRASNLLFLLTVAACSAAPTQSDVDRGRALFESGALSSSAVNAFSCSTCHDGSVATSPVRRKPGAPLAGVTERPSFWGGQENDLLLSVDVCLRKFMTASEPLASADPNAIALYAYLLSLEPGDPEPFPFSVVGAIANVPRGDAGAGQRVFESTCAPCHGARHSGAGRLSATIPVLPDDTLLDHAEYGAFSQRLIFIEKIRHGVFFDYGGAMPPFSRELLSDAELADLLEALGLLGE